MTATNTHGPTKAGLNDLEVGSTYTAATGTGRVCGEYLGVETPHGVWSILLRGSRRTASVPIEAISAIRLIK